MIDLSDAAISLRIHQVSQLRKLCLSLGQAILSGPASGPESSLKPTKG